MSDCRFGVSPVNIPDPDPDFFLTTFRRFNWDKYFIIYDKVGQGEIVELFCHLATSSLYDGINEKAPQIRQHYYKIGRSDIEEDHMLPQQVGFQYSGKAIR